MIRVEKVSKWYEKDGIAAAPVLEDVSLHIEQGQFVCIIGPSGCGKTTLLNLIAGFIKPVSGRILFRDLPVKGPGPDRGVVFQDANLFPWLTVQKNVEFGLRQQKPRQNAYARKAVEYLEIVGMSAHATAWPHTLSGGMRQRTAIARVLALEPAALLMDEPFSSLDANSREHLQDELLRIWLGLKRTLVYITHSVAEAAYLADRVIVMGPDPGNVRGDIEIPLPRPRRRTSSELREMTATLRNALDGLPCCLKPESGHIPLSRILSSVPKQTLE